MADKSLNQIEKFFDNHTKAIESLNKDIQKLIDNPYGSTAMDNYKSAKADTQENLKNFNEAVSKLKSLNKDLIEEQKKLLKAEDELAEKKIKLSELKEKGNFLKLSSLKATNDELKKINEEIIKNEEEVESLNNEINELNNTYKEQEEIVSKLHGLHEEKNNSEINYLKSIQEELKLNNELYAEGYTGIDDFVEKFDRRTKGIQTGFGRIKEGFSNIGSGSNKMLEPWMKAEQAARDFGRSVGMSKATSDAFLKNTLNFATENKIGILFDKTTDELIKMQNKYSDVVGRNVQLTDEQKISMLSMEKFLGEDGMTDIANNLENFGLGMSDSADFVKKTLDEATKHGISASKLTKTIRENIKMAQNYSFKNGLEGLTSMAKKAIELKTDMSVINGFIEKTSTLEGAITTGAQLQVLGGSYAMGANPLTMMYESLNNVEGLFDRAVNMVKGKVFYNSATGNFDMANQDRYILKQVATSMGIDPSKLIDMAYRNASMSRIEGVAKANTNINGDEDMIRLVKNLATWKNGEAFVNINGKDVNVKDLDIKDKESLESIQKTDSQNLTDMAINLRSVKEILSGTVKEGENEQANMMAGIGENVSKLLINNDESLKTISKISAWMGVISSTIMMASGIFDMVRGGGNVFKGVGGWFKRTPTAGTPTSTTTTGAPTTGVPTQPTGGFKPKIGSAMKMGGGASIASAGISLINSAVTGELMENPGRSLGIAAGNGVGAFIGGALGSFAGPGGAMIGSMLGSTLGEWVATGIADWGKEEKEKARAEIATRLKSSSSNLYTLFEGENALTGNYSEKELLQIEDAIKDRRLDGTDLSESLLNKIRKNGDLVKMNKSGVQINVAYGSGGVLGSNGGILYGKSHADGGMPILGSNILVEGGEYVVNKESTKRNLPLLERINNDYKMTALEPLGKQMRVNQHSNSLGGNMPHNKIEMNPISINLSGTIKLDTGNSQVDLPKELLNNPILITKLTEMISKELNKLDFGSYNKGKFKQKFT